MCTVHAIYLSLLTLQPTGRVALHGEAVSSDWVTSCFNGLADYLCEVGLAASSLLVVLPCIVQVAVHQQTQRDSGMG